uniref:Si:ch73-233m11.2 n=1 Tax=Oryzias melastigma TaxID=30732 RepID=A0A3B3BWL3_ORYME
LPASLYSDAVLTELLRTKETSTFLGGESPTTVITGSKYIPLLSGAVQGDCTVDYAVDAALLSEIRGVLLIGPEGSGKSTALQKLAVDWAQGERLQNFSFVFHFNLRDFNSLGGERSLKALLQSSHPSLTAGSVAVVAKRPEEVLFVFDSLDQYRHSLDPSVHALCSDPNQEAAVSCLVASLLHGSLLRGSAFVVATRPTSNLKYLNGTHVEVLGFSKLQREVYFTNCFTDANATKPLLHMERTLGFYNICSSPRFCWTVCSIYSLLLDSGAKLPETLSQLFVDILVHLMETLCLNEASVRALVSPLGRMASLCLLDHSNIAQESIKSFGCQQLLTAVDAFLVVDGDPESDKCTFSFRSQLMQEFILALAFFLRESPGEGVEHFLTKHKGRATFLDFFLSGLSEEVQRRPLETLLGKANPDQIEDFRRWFKSSSAETWRGYEKDKHYRCFHLLHQAQNEALTKEIITPSARLEYHTDLSLQDCVALNYVAMSFNKIPSLSLCGTNILPEMAKFLTPTMSVSHSLNFSHCTFSTGAIPHLASALRNGVVSDLCLYNSHCGDEMLNVLATSLQNSKLQKLRGKKYLTSLELFKNSNCCFAFSLHGCDLTGGCCDDLVPLLTSQLCTLVINFNQIGDDGFIKLCKALNCPHNRLMHNCNLTAASMEAFAEALCSGQSHLRKVNLRANKIGDDGVRALSKSFLNRCELTPPVFKELASLLKVGTLKSLSVGVNDVGDKGAKYLWEAVAHPNCLLEDVEMTGLTDACVEDLCAALRASKTLKRLEMKNNSLTDVSVPAIIRAFQDSANMQELNLRYNDFSEEVLHLLDEAKIRY